LSNGGGEAREAVTAEAVAHLRALIRLNTVNPPGNELRTARYLAGVLDQAGIAAEVIEAAPGRGVVIARIRGSGQLAPVMLVAHMDVVGVEADKWTTDPFGGEVRDGYVYGRGAIDDKGMLAANLQAMLLLKRGIDRGDLPLDRDVVFLASCDEETGGEWGMEWLLSHRPELTEAEFALNEGGRIRVVDGRPLYAAIQTAEKVPHVLTVTATGPSGHAAVPLRGNAVVRLGRALAAIGEHREPVVLGDTTRSFFAQLGAIWADAREAFAMADITSNDPERVKRGEAVLAEIPTLDALLRTGISATMVDGGIRVNVIPAEAGATLNVRTLPGELVEDVAARLTAAIGDPLVTVEVTSRGSDTPAVPVNSPMFAAISASVAEAIPGLVAVPYLSTGATDNSPLRRAGVGAYGLLPFPLAQEDERRMHGHDERIPVAALGTGVEIVLGAVRRVGAAAKDGV
jgi:acetylornithine deacetylase/succinyl-diaminopimelate desuccinylase-like protein